MYGGHGPLTVIPYPCRESVWASRAVRALNDAARARGTRNAASSRSGPRCGGSSLAGRRFASLDLASSRSYSFATVLRAREARVLSKVGYGMTVSGPWPPYTFVQD